MELARSWEEFEDDKPLWKEIIGHLLQFPDHIATEKKTQANFSDKQKKKKGPKIRLSHLVGPSGVH